MTEYLLAAEADQIQDFIFRASHLREVVGGSQLLTRFCNEVPQQLLGGGERIVVNDGGAFRIVFNDLNQARTFGENLAEIYRRAADGAITVAEPEEIKNGDFAKASEAAEEKLRVAKRWRQQTVQTTPQMPFTAWCASCGAGLAIAYGNRHADERANYLCRACMVKGRERDSPGEGTFLRPFLQLVTGGRAGTFDWPMEAKDTARFDPRRYVAYLMADGNNLGKLFGQCNEEQMRELSKQMTQKLRQALAAPTRKAMTQRDARGEVDPFKVPVLPLILGGDDLFALVPAPWALDFALKFCREFETGMAQIINGLKLTVQVERPTIAAVVVICKESYPYRLAYRAGVERLGRAKQLSKALAYETGEHLSVVDFEIILGSQIVEAPREGTRRPTLRPFWVLPEDNQSMPSRAEQWGLPLHRLINQRLKLSGLPNKRLAQLRSLFDRLPDSTAELESWRMDLEQLLGRVGRDEEAEKITRAALAQLGSGDSGWLYKINRKTDEAIWHGHALLDLLEAWDFAFDLDKDRDVYKEA
ncbi:MAG: hypothetical protein AABO57_08765 [Acidobacteriota bacterium]